MLFFNTAATHATIPSASRSVVNLHAVFASLPVETFNNLHPLPDLAPGTDGHYSAFEKIYGTQTTEQHRPSLQA